VESAPPDLLTWTLVGMVREKFSAPTAEVVVTVYEMKSVISNSISSLSNDSSSKPSGGTLATVLSFMDHYTFKQISAALKPYALSPVPGPKVRDPTTWVTKLFGVRSVRDLGILTTSLAGTSDTAIVHRSWGQFGYGPNFRYHEFMKARNYLTAVAIHLGLLIAGLCLSIGPIRKLAKKYVYQPGDGPTKDEYKNDRFEYRGIAMPDLQTTNPHRAFASLSFESSCYVFTAVSLAEAAISILRDEHKLAGGVYTPSSLGQPFIDRLSGAGMKIQKKIFEN